MPDYQKLRQEAIALREQGFSMRQIGQRLGLQSGTITPPKMTLTATLCFISRQLTYASKAIPIA
jgi:DNA-binding NarL/FixJ family response regulator